jgi:hypothetical protein
MSKNLPKKLELKAELLRHLDTAERMMDQHKPSSVLRAISLIGDIATLDHGGQPDMEFWREVMAE